MKVPVHYADDVALERARKKSVLARRARTRAQKPVGLRACPFCRELFTEDEGDVCPDCGVALRDHAELPLSPEAEALIHEEAAAKPHEHTIPQAEPLPWRDLSRGRGVLLACALGGLAAFYVLPWMQQTLPHAVTYTGPELARHMTRHFWATFTAWLVLFPAVASRRTLLKMHGARPALVVLSALPGVWCATLLLKGTRVVDRMGVAHEWQWGVGFWATLALSIVATVVSFRFGGRLDDVKVRHGSSVGEVLH